MRTSRTTTRLRRAQQNWRCRLAAGAASLVFLAFSLGCMSLSIGGRTEMAPPENATPLPSEQHPYKQCGELSLSAKQEQDVYYPVPFQFPPNLQVESLGNIAVVVDQKADRFRVKHPYEGSDVHVTWQARGVPIGIAPVGPPPVVAGPTPNGPPLQPVGN